MNVQVLRNHLREFRSVGCTDSPQLGPIVDSVLASFLMRVHGYAQTPAADYASVRAHLITEARRFHDHAQTLTPGVTKALDDIAGGCQLLRVSHQPNSLTGLNILIPLLMLTRGTTSSAKVGQPVTVFFIVDYDEARDQRFRTPVLPSPSGQGVLFMESAVRKVDRHRIAAAVPTPRPVVLKSWGDQLLWVVKAWSTQLRRLGLDVPSRRAAVSQTEALVGELHSVMQAEHFLTQANAVLLSRLCNNVWGLDAIFVFERRMWAAVSADLVRFLSLDIPQAERDEIRLGLWRLCLQCHERCPTTVYISGTGDLVADWRCAHCATSEFGEAVTWDASPESDKDRLPTFIPKVGLSDLADISCYGFAGGAGYAGGIEHVVRSRCWARKHSFVAPPELAADPLDVLLPGEDCNSLFNGRRTDMVAWEAFQTAKYPAVFFSALVERGDVPSRLWPSSEGLGQGHPERPSLYRLPESGPS